METDKEDDQNREGQETSAEAAGLVRGISRSIRGSGRAMARLPSIGRLPRRAVIKQRRVPVRRVAAVSDRVSTGLDVFSTAVETTGVESDDRPWRRRRILPRLKTFASALVKNTILGAAVFETYGYTVSYLAPPADDASKHNGGLNDDYARTALGGHYLAGANAGFVHSFLYTVMESPGQPGTLQRLPAMTLHHVVAHSLLFGSFESIKRTVLHRLPQEEEEEENTQHDGFEYLGSVALAGGFAGQIQHISSHYTEQWLRLEEPIQQQRPQRHLGLLARLTAAAPPTVRHTLWAFPPSAIGFVAFEYGKSLVS